jgi:hypothetical protein
LETTSTSKMRLKSGKNRRTYTTKNSKPSKMKLTDWSSNFNKPSNSHFPFKCLLLAYSAFCLFFAFLPFAFFFFAFIIFIRSLYIFVHFVQFISKCSISKVGQIRLDGLKVDGLKVVSSNPQ